MGGVIIGEDGSVLGEDVKEVYSTDLYGPRQVLVGWGDTHTEIHSNYWYTERSYKVYRVNLINCMTSTHASTMEIALQ